MDNKELDRISYALGLSMGNNFRASGIQTINVEDFADGVAAVFYGAEPKMTYDEAKAEIQKFFEGMEAKQKAEAEKMAEINAQAGKAYLEENGKRAEVKTTPSGLQYEVLVEGDGPTPKSTDRVEVHYTGKLIDGTVFDSSVDRGVPATFGVTQVIPRMGRGTPAHESRFEVASPHPLTACLRPQRSRRRHRPQRHPYL